MQASQALHGASLSIRQHMGQVERERASRLTYGVFCLSYTYLSSTCWYIRQSPAIFLVVGMSMCLLLVCTHLTHRQNTRSFYP